MCEIAQLYSWLESQNARRSVDVCQSSHGGRGLCASRDLSVGDVCLSIPKKLLITAAHSLAECPMLEKLSEGLPEELEKAKDTVIIILFLILQKVRKDGTSRTRSATRAMRAVSECSCLPESSPKHVTHNTCRSWAIPRHGRLTSEFSPRHTVRSITSRNTSLSICKAPRCSGCTAPSEKSWRRILSSSRGMCGAIAFEPCVFMPESTGLTPVGRIFQPVMSGMRWPRATASPSRSSTGAISCGHTASLRCVCAHLRMKPRPISGAVGSRDGGPVYYMRSVCIGALPQPVQSYW
jgi:hypothetical protein